MRLSRIQMAKHSVCLLDSSNQRRPQAPHAFWIWLIITLLFFWNASNLVWSISVVLVTFLPASQCSALTFCLMDRNLGLDSQLLPSWICTIAFLSNCTLGPLLLPLPLGFLLLLSEEKHRKQNNQRRARHEGTLLQQKQSLL